MYHRPTGPAARGGPATNGFSHLATAAALARGIVAHEAVDLDNLKAGLAGMNPQMAQAAVRHKIGGLLLDQMRRLGVNAEAPVMEGLKAKVRADASTRMLLVRHWRGAVKALADNGIPCLTLKGPAASLQLYGTPTAREFVDLDILVNLPDPIVAAPALDKAGFVILDSQPIGKAPRRYRCFFTGMRHLKFEHRELPTYLELHHSSIELLEEFFPISVADLFTESATIEHDGAAFSAPNPVDHALYLFFHGARHDWSLLHWLLDAAFILSPSCEDMHSPLARKAKSLGMERMVGLAAHLVHRVFGLDLPPVIEEMRAGVRKASLLSFLHCRRCLEFGSPSSSRVPAKIRHTFFHLGAILPGSVPRLRLLGELLKATPWDTVTPDLPDGLYFLYLFLRPFKILIRRLSNVLVPAESRGP